MTPLVTQSHPAPLNSQEQHEIGELLQVAQSSLLDLAASLNRQRVSPSLILQLEHYASRAYELRQRLQAH